MKYQALAALGISAFLVSAQALGQDDEDVAAAPAKSDAKPADAKPADKAADAKADKTDKAEAKAADEPAPAAKAEASVSSDALSANASATGNPAEGGDETEGAASRPPIYGKRGDWNITPYGYA